MSKTTECGKCGGNGKYHFSAGESGVCFACRGTGVVKAVAVMVQPTYTRAQAIVRISETIRNAHRCSDFEGSIQHTLENMGPGNDDVVARAWAAVAKVRRCA